MGFELDRDQLALRDAARRFTLGELTPNAPEWDAKKHFPRDVIARAGSLGFCGLYAPEEWGGLALSRLDSAIILEELAGGCTSTAAFISIHNMVAWMLCTWGSKSTKERWGPALCSGQKLGSYCLTEPNAGSDAGSLKTTATPCGDGYVINGSKMFISGAGSTELLLVMARTGSQESGAAGVTALAVPADTPGISFGKSEEKLGWNSQPTCSISFDQVEISTENRIGVEGEGFKIAMRGIDGGRINIAACSLGAAQACIDHTQVYMNDRHQFNRPLSEFQALQFRFADMATELIAARLMVHKAAAALDADLPNKTVLCAMGKRYATDVGFNVCNEALQLHGGYGYLREFPIERFLRDSRVHQILEGTNEVMRIIMSRYLFEDGATKNLR